jgi:hypothetical protein
MPLVPPRPRQLYVKLRQYHSRSCSASGMLHIQLLFSTIHMFLYYLSNSFKNSNFAYVGSGSFLLLMNDENMNI